MGSSGTASGVLAVLAHPPLLLSTRQPAKQAAKNHNLKAVHYPGLQDSREPIEVVRGEPEACRGDVLLEMVL